MEEEGWKMRGLGRALRRNLKERSQQQQRDCQAKKGEKLKLNERMKGFKAGREG